MYKKISVENYLGVTSFHQWEPIVCELSDIFEQHACFQTCVLHIFCYLPFLTFSLDLFSFWVGVTKNSGVHSPFIMLENITSTVLSNQLIYLDKFKIKSTCNLLAIYLAIYHYVFYIHYLYSSFIYILFFHYYLY